MVSLCQRTSDEKIMANERKISRTDKNKESDTVSFL